MNKCVICYVTVLHQTFIVQEMSPHFSLFWVSILVFILTFLQAKVSELLFFSLMFLAKKLDHSFASKNLSDCELLCSNNYEQLHVKNSEL